MTNKFIKQNNYAEMSVLNVKSIKVTNGENKYNIPLQVSLKGGGGMNHFVNSRVARDTVIQSGNWRGACDTARELEEST